jgi:hypothetical protein
MSLAPEFLDKPVCRIRSADGFVYFNLQSEALQFMKA